MMENLLTRLFSSYSFIHSFISLAFQFSKTKGLLPKQTLHFPTVYQSNVISGNNTQCMLDERASGHRLRLNPLINRFTVRAFWHLSSTSIRFTHISIKHSLRVDIRYRSHTIRGSCSSVDKKSSHLFRRYRKTLLNEFLWGKGASLSSLMMKKSDWSTASATWLTMELRRKKETCNVNTTYYFYRYWVCRVVEVYGTNVSFISDMLVWSYFCPVQLNLLSFYLNNILHITYFTPKAATCCSSKFFADVAVAVLGCFCSGT